LTRAKLFSMPELLIVGLGPSDARLLTIGALESLRAASSVFTCDAAPATLQYLRDEGVPAQPLPMDSGALMRGVQSAVDQAASLFSKGDAALGVPGHPLLDFP
jgi:precorrin-2 methylase